MRLSTKAMMKLAINVSWEVQFFRVSKKKLAILVFAKCAGVNIINYLEINFYNSVKDSAL